MDAPPPWKILGAAQYRLGRNQERKVRILCAPDEEQELLRQSSLSLMTLAPRSSFSRERDIALRVRTFARNRTRKPGGRHLAFRKCPDPKSHLSRSNRRNLRARPRLPHPIRSPFPPAEKRELPCKPSRPSWGVGRRAQLRERRIPAQHSLAGFCIAASSCGSNRAKDLISGTSSPASATRDSFESRTRAEAPLGCRQRRRTISCSCLTRTPPSFNRGKRGFSRLPCSPPRSATIDPKSSSMPAQASRFQ